MRAVLLAETIPNRKVLLELLKTASSRDWTMNCPERMQAVALLQGMLEGKKDCYQLIRNADSVLGHFHLTFGVGVTVGMLARLHNYGFAVTHTKAPNKAFLAVITGSIKQWIDFIQTNHKNELLRDMADAIRNELGNYTLLMRE